jgi:type VI secretion system protein ImpH
MRHNPPPAAPGLQPFWVRLRAQPWKFGFTALMRRLGALHPEQPRIGMAQRPQQEPFRLGQTAALTFAPREIAEVVLPTDVGDGPEHGLPQAPTSGLTPRAGNDPSKPMVRLYGLGLLGPNGPLPLHFTELVRERSENHQDNTLADFLDIFHHRYLTLMYRAWAQSQSAAGLDRADDETFSRYVAQLTGHDPLEIRDSVLPSHARLAASPHLGREARNPDGLAQTLSRFFAVPVHLQEFVLHWIEIEDEDQTRLGRARASCVLGTGAMAGEVVADRQNKFRLVLGPLNLQQYLRFTPQGKDLPLLTEWVRGFVGYEFAWEVELRLRTDSAPPARLEEKGRLGWSTWLGGSQRHGLHGTQTGLSGTGDAAGYAVGMVFEPERYVRSETQASRPSDSYNLS